MSRGGQHSCKSFEHYTPVAYVEAVRYVLGAIDLDPASCATANAIVRAACFYTREQDGLSQPWFGRVYVNPPGDPHGVLVKAFWRRACGYALRGEAAVVWAGYSLGPVPRLYACAPFEDGTRCPGPMSWPHVIIGPEAPCTTGGGRICWIDGVTGKPGKRPGHGNYFCLLGGDAAMRERFRERFGAFGDYRAPSHPPRRTRDLASEILAILAGEGPMSKSGLARRIGARKQAVIKAVDALAHRGAIVRVGVHDWIAADGS